VISKRSDSDALVPWPVDLDEEVVPLTGRELNWLLDGIDIFRLRPHKTLSYHSVL